MGFEISNPNLRSKSQIPNLKSKSHNSNPNLIVNSIQQFEGQQQPPQPSKVRIRRYPGCCCGRCGCCCCCCCCFCRCCCCCCCCFCCCCIIVTRTSSTQTVGPQKHQQRGPKLGRHMVPVWSQCGPSAGPSVIPMIHA